MAEIIQTERAAHVMTSALGYCRKFRHEFIMPEHLLLALVDDSNFNTALAAFLRPPAFASKIEKFLAGIETVPEGTDYEPQLSTQTGQLLKNAVWHVERSEAESLDIPHLVSGLMELKDSWAAYYLNDCIGDQEH